MMTSGLNGIRGSVGEKSPLHLKPPTLEQNNKAARRPPFPRLPLHPQNLVSILRPGEGAVLEVVLQNARRQRWTQRAALRLNRADDFSAANHFGSR